MASELQLKKDIAKRISQLLITSGSEISAVGGITLDVYNILEHQRVIFEGKPKTGRSSSDERLLIYGNELQAAFEDVDEITTIADSLIVETAGDIDLAIQIANNLKTSTDITGVWFGPPAATPSTDPAKMIKFSALGDIISQGTNPQNVGQYIPISSSQATIDLDKAKEILDTEITELIPDKKTREDRIRDFFKEWILLKGDLPRFDTDNDQIIDDNWWATGSDAYATYHDADQQDNPFEGYITRIGDTGYTMQVLRDQLDLYLKDLDFDPDPTLADGRSEYENISSGYVKLRNLNQGIIIRRQEGNDVGLEEIVTTSVGTGPSYLVDGFTITMWVRFLDKVNTGTLFNYGNPERNIDPKGFKIETFVIHRDELTQNGSDTWYDLYPADFGDDDHIRMVRLVLRDGGSLLRDSNVGVAGRDRLDTITHGLPDFGDTTTEYALLNYTKIPINFEDWYFIVASYNPTNDESSTHKQNTDYWLGYTDSGGSSHVSSPSGYGAKCKVEVISKSDLLRARGYAPE